MTSSVGQLLFDLDGTLADTAPDLASALNEIRTKRGRPVLPFEKIRPVVSLGGKAMIKQGFNIDENAPEFPELLADLLETYSKNICLNTHLFPGMDQLLNYLDLESIKWGIVTNKPGWLTTPLLEALELTERPQCVISGDTLPQRKPRPEPLLHACKIMKCLPTETAYIGDAKRDIEAGKNADMYTVAARYGYISDDMDLDTWGANRIVDSPTEILEWLTNQAT